MTNDVADILAILNGYAQGNIGFYTYPRSPGGYNLSRYVWAGLFDGSGADGVPTKDKSYLKRISDALDVAATNGVDLLPVLDYLSGMASDLSGMASGLSGIPADLSAIYGQLYGFRDDVSQFEYGLGREWAVHLDDVQMGDIMSALYSVSNSVSIGIGDGLDSLGGGTNLAALAVSLGRLEEYVERIRDDAETDTLYPDADAVEMVDDTSDLPATNAVELLTLPDPDLGDNTSVLDVLDTSAVSGVLPSLTGGDARIAILGTEGESGPVPYVEADLSLPPGLQRTMHAVAVWLWRLLFALGVWRIVRDEYAYWSTLGGSAVA